MSPELQCCEILMTAGSSAKVSLAYPDERTTTRVIEKESGGGDSLEHTGLHLKFPDNWENTGNYSGIRSILMHLHVIFDLLSEVYIEIP